MAKWALIAGGSMLFIIGGLVLFGKVGIVIAYLLGVFTGVGLKIIFGRR